MRNWRILALAFILLLTCVQLVSSLAQINVPGFYPETGHAIYSIFLPTYQNTPNARQIYGLPITGAFNVTGSDGVSEITVQYFERARFEYDPNKAAGVQVSLSSLGFTMYEYDQQRQPGTVIEAPPGLAACRTFSETVPAHQVCYAFLEFFDNNGGISQFGYPISDLEDHAGLMVQYFQRARFEWHPNAPAGERVVLSKLGEIYFDVIGENPSYKMPDSINNIIIKEPGVIDAPILQQINVRAFVAQAVIGNGEQQTIYVIVEDQTRMPIRGAQVTFNFDSADSSQGLIMPLTNEQGITQLTFPVQNAPIGLNSLVITVHYENADAKFDRQTVTSYQVWW